MNVERLNAVADAIENGLPRVTFNMAYYSAETECGTVACIAGHAMMLMIQRGEGRLRTDGLASAMQWLELDLQDASDLFSPSSRRKGFPYRDLCDIDKGVAVRCIRNFARGGDINWARAHDEFFWGSDG